MFSSESGSGVATRNSQLRCTVLTFPATSFTSYAGTLSATWQTTTYSVSLHQSLTFHFLWYASFFISTTSPSTNCMVLVVLLFFGLPICLEVCLSIGLLEASSNLHHICGHMMGVLKLTHHREIIINREVRATPKHQIM